MTFLKQSTAVDIKMGPFLDSTDGNTVEGGLTITQPDIMLAKNGGNWAQKNAAQTLSHENQGWYEVSLDATDTNTLGILIVAIHESGALPVWREFMVLPANAYDALVSGTGVGVRADIQGIVGDAATAAKLKRAVDPVYQGSVTGAATATTLIDSTLTQSATDHWKGRILIFLTGSLTYQATDITAFDPATDKLTFTALTGAPSGGDLYVIV